MLTTHTHAEPVRTQHRETFPDDVWALPEGCEVNGATLRKPLDEAFDFVIVGSGASGATAAVVLAEVGFSVAIVEEGPWVRTREFTKDLHPAMQKMFRSHGTSVMSGRSLIPIMQGSCVGGSTTINSAIAWRAPDEVIHDWSVQFGLGNTVSVDSLAPHFDGLETELHVSSVDDGALGNNNGLFGSAAAKLGFESHRIKRYDAGCKGSAGCLTGCSSAKKLSMNVTFVPRALRAGAKIFYSMKVNRVVTEGSRAVGVRATAKGPTNDNQIPVQLWARKGVLVAASTVHTPNLLRRSGVRSAALGKHFQAHPGVSMMGLFDKPVGMEFGAAQGYNSLAFLKSDRIKLESLSLPPELASARIPGVGAELQQRFSQYRNLAAWCVVVRSDAEGSVAERWGQDHVRFDPSKQDMVRARKGLKILTEMMFASGAKEVYPGVFGMPSVLKPNDIGLWDNAPVDASSI